ncbi:hypothetical protein J7J39_02370, partial [bacterium]|nr:hypothetical protein [bacterium]
MLVLVFLATSVWSIEIVQAGKVVAPHPNTGEEFLILVSDNFWNVPEIQEAIERYQDDVYRHRQVGSRIFMVSPAVVPLCNSDYESSLEIRNFLKSQYYSNPLGARLVGILLVGDIPWVMISKRPEGPGDGKNNACYEDVPGDIYFAELSLEGWKVVICPCGDINCLEHQQTVLALPDDCYSNLNNCLQPEIWVTRLRPIISFGWWQEFSFSERVEMLVHFFEKDHRYYEGELGRENKDFIHFNWMKGVFGCDYCNCDDPTLFPLEEGDEFICHLDGMTSEEFLNWWLPQPWRLVHTYSHGIMTDHGRGVGGEELYNALIATPIFLAEGCSTACLCGGYSDIEGLIFGPQSDVLVAIGCNRGCTGFPIPDLKFDYVAKAFWERTRGEQLLTLQIEGDPFMKVCTVDITSPEVTIDSLSCSVNGGTITFSAKATDPSGIGAISLFKTTDPSWNTYDILKTCYNTTYCSANFSGQAGKTYYLQVNATDKHGNLRVKKT